MSGGVEVLEEAGVDQPTPNGSRRPWAVPLAAFAVGVLAGAVFFGPVVAPTEDTVSPDPATPLAPGEEDGAGGVGRVVPGMEQALVAVVTSPDGVEYLLWPLARSPSTLGLPASDAQTVTIDPSGLWLAMLTPLPDAEGNLFSSGRPTAVRPVVTGVDSYAWHDSALGRMALLRQVDGSWGIYEAAAFPDPEIRIELGPDHPGTLVGFGAWGWAMQGPASFDVVGTERRSYQGRFLDSSPDGFLVSEAGDVVFVVGGNRLGLTTGEATAARFSPDGTRAAVLEADGVTIVTIDAVSEKHYPMDPGAEQLDWAGDRFVVVPRSSRGIWILDTETGETSAHLTDYDVSWAGVITLRS